MAEAFGPGFSSPAHYKRLYAALSAIAVQLLSAVLQIFSLSRKKRTEILTNFKIF